MITDKFPNIKGLLLDMDGVLWHNSMPIGNLPKIFNTINSLGLRTIFLTNNATKIANDYVDKLNSFGVSVSPEQIITNAEATAAYIQDNFISGSHIHVFASQALKNLIAEKGFIVNGDKPKKFANAVIVGLDTDLNYQKIAEAASLIREGAAFIATNTDATFPAENGLLPGAGTVVMAVQTASGRKPIVIGKPNEIMYNLVVKKFQIPSRQIMAVGDRLETDIAGAQKFGFLTALVLSGVSQTEDALSWHPSPDLICQDLETLIYG